MQHRELRTPNLAGLVYAALVVVPLSWLVGPWLARALADAPETRATASVALRFAPLAVLAMGPMFQVRSTFEGLQRPRPGLLASALRAFALVVPLVWLGLALAPRLGRQPIVAACATHALGGGVASALLVWWFLGTLREERGG